MGWWGGWAGRGDNNRWTKNVFKIGPSHVGRGGGEWSDHEYTLSP